MTLRRCLVAGWLGCMGAAAVVPGAVAQEYVDAVPRRFQIEGDGPIVLNNQQKADAIVAALQNNKSMRGYHIDVVVTGGVAELQGQVVDAMQRELAQATALSVPGIVRVDNRLSLLVENIRPVQDIVPNFQPGFNAPAPGMVMPPQMGPQMPVQMQPQMPPQGGPQLIPNNPYGAEPQGMPVGRPGMMPNPMYQPPPLPPYAWPTYAPYNNYSRVATPLGYSASQWPFIGPMYPYPKVPLGWRKITLEWQDGSWWYGRESNGKDWWRVRYW